MRLGLIRIDKMGDLINTLPIDQAEALHGHEVFWAINQGLKPFVDLSQPPRHVTEIPTEDGWQGFSELRAWIRAHKIEAAVVFYAPWWVSMALFLERVPVRMGRKSQWHSFLFLNKTFRQSRSLSEKHEADYNLELVRKTLGGAEERTPILRLQAPPARHLLEKYSLQGKNFFVVHPGMAGSALNWPQSKYIQVIRELLKTATVVITGTPIDDPSLTEVRQEFEKHRDVRWLQNKLDLPSLIYILSQARAVVAPSTGVAHLAGSLGVPVITLFPNNTKQSPVRWAPRGDKIQIFDLDQTTPETVVRECLRNP